MSISIVIICDKIRIKKLNRLLTSMGNSPKPEILLIHESNESRPPPILSFPLRYIPIPEKQGIAFNRNEGIKHATGDIIVFIDDDCWVHDKWLTFLTQPFEDESVFSTTSGTHIPKSNLVGDSISALGFPGGGSLGFSKVWKVTKDGFTNHLTVGNCALRREVFNKVGLFDDSMKSGAEDAEFSCRMEKRGIRIKYVPQATAFHEARTTVSEFVKWQLRRGRANYQFKKKVGSVGSFVKLRMWSAGNIIKKNKFNPLLPLIFSFLGASFALQQVGFLMESRKK